MRRIRIGSTSSSNAEKTAGPAAGVESCKGNTAQFPPYGFKHRSDGCGTASALPKCSIMSGCGTRIVLRGQKPLALCDRCPCFGSLFPPLAALTFAASSIICAFGLAAAAPRSPYRHLELCGIALDKIKAYAPCQPGKSGQSGEHVLFLFIWAFCMDRFRME